MDFLRLTDLITLALLVAMFVMIWRARKQFLSFKLILLSTVFVTLGRISDAVAQNPHFGLASALHLPHDLVYRFIVIAGNFCDAIGISLLLYGFFLMVKLQNEEEKLIEELERLLPICASCKKYRTKAGEWMPIERYLKESGSPNLTHTVCPECSIKLYGDVLLNNQ
jgi:hypothetical protein